MIKNVRFLALLVVTAALRPLHFALPQGDGDGGDGQGGDSYSATAQMRDGDIESGLPIGQEPDPESALRDAQSIAEQVSEISGQDVEVLAVKDDDTGEEFKV